MSDPITIGDKPAGNRRALTLLGVAAAVLLAVVVLPGMLFGGGGGAPTSTDVLAPGTSSAAAATSATTVPSIVRSTVVPSTKAKDPFKPLVAVAPASADQVVTVTAASPTDPTLVLPEQAGVLFGEEDLSTLPDLPVFVSDPAASSSSEPNRVSLLEVYRDPSGQLVASVRVNDLTYQVTGGDELAGSYTVISLDGSSRCAVLGAGDHDLRLCEGDEVIDS